MPRRVLLFDDDASLRDSLSKSSADFDAEVMPVATEAQLIGAAQSERPDLVIVGEQRGRNVRLVCERLARAPAIAGVPIVAIVASAAKVPDPKEAIVAFATRGDGANGVLAVVRRFFDGEIPEPVTATDDDDLDFTLVPDEELAATRLSRLSMSPVITPARSKPASNDVPRPKGRASVRPPPERKNAVEAKRSTEPKERTARASVRPPGERTSRPDSKRASTPPQTDKAPRRSMRPGADRNAEPPPAPRPRASSKETASGSTAGIEKRVRELEEQLANARRERDESDAAWSEWVTSAEQFANEMWSDRETLRKAHNALQRALQAAAEDARLAKQREAAERERRELLTAEVASFRKDVTRRASILPGSPDTAALARTAEELSSLRRQLADAMQKLQVSEATRNEAERNGDKLRVALDAAEAQAQRTNAELAAERDRASRGGTLTGTASDREELRKVRARLGEEQKRAIAISVELSAAKRESEQRLKTARTEATSALDALRESLGGELRNAREQLKQATARLETREHERDDARARLHAVESEREGLARTLAERETTLSDEASRADEASQRAASITDEFAEWRRRVEDERADRERAWTDQLAAQEKLYTGIADALRSELDEVRAAKKEVDRREAEARGAAERAERSLEQMRVQFEAAAGESTRSVRETLARERADLEARVQSAQREATALAAERDAMRSEIERANDRLRAAEAARDELTALQNEAISERDAAIRREGESARQGKALRVSIDQEKRRVAEANAAREASETALRAEIESQREQWQAALAQERTERSRAADEATRQLAETSRRAEDAEARLRDQVARVEAVERDLEQAKQSRDEIVRSLEGELQQADGVRLRVDEANARAAALEAQIESDRAAAQREVAQAREGADAAKRRLEEREAEHERALAFREKAIGEARTERDAARRETEALRQAHANELRALDERIADARREALDSIEKARADLERDLAESREALRRAEGREQSARDELERTRAQANAKDEQLAQWDTERQRSEATKRELEDRVASLDTQIAAERTESERERARAEAVSRDAELAERTARSAMERTEETHRAEIASLTARVRTLETSAAEEATRHRNALSAAEERANVLRKERDEHAAQTAKLQNDRTILQRQIETARAEFGRREVALREEAAAAAKQRDQAKSEQGASITELQGELDRAKASAAEAMARANEVSVALEAEHAERERLDQALRAAESALADERAASAERSQGAAQHDDEIAQARAALAAAEALLADERKRALDAERAASTARTSLETDLAAARDDNTIVAASLRAAQEQIDALEDGIELREAVANSIREERDQLAERRARDEESLAEARRLLEDARRQVLETQARADDLDERVAEVQREADARVELLRTQSNAAMRTLRSRVDGDSEKVRKRFEELSTWLSDAEKRAGDLMSETEHQRRLRAKAEQALAAAEHSVRELGSRLEVERAQAEELAEQLEFERKRFDELKTAATRTATRASRPDTPDLRAELERIKADRARIEKDLSDQLADLSTGLMARDAAIANLRQQLTRMERQSRKKGRDEPSTEKNPLPSPEVIDRLQTLERERDAARVDFLRRVQEIERNYTERLIAMAKADGSQVMFALSERVVALQNASARPVGGEDATKALEEEIEALRRENEFLMAEIERNAQKA